MNGSGLVHRYRFRHLPGILVLSVVGIAFPLMPGISDASRGSPVHATAAGVPGSPVPHHRRRPVCTPGFICSGPARRQQNRQPAATGRSIVRLAMMMGAAVR